MTVMVPKTRARTCGIIEFVEKLGVKSTYVTAKPSAREIRQGAAKQGVSLLPKSTLSGRGAPFVHSLIGVLARIAGTNAKITNNLNIFEYFLVSKLEEDKFLTEEFRRTFDSFISEKLD